MVHKLFFSVKSAKCNGDTRIGNQNKLDLVLFIKQTMLAFHHMDESSQSKRPLDWIMRVDALLQHCKGDHSQCGILERYGILKFCYIDYSLYIVYKSFLNLF